MGTQTQYACQAEATQGAEGLMASRFRAQRSVSELPANDQLYEDWLKHALRTLKEKTWVRYKGVVRDFIADLNHDDIKPPELTENQLLEWLEDKREGFWCKQFMPTLIHTDGPTCRAGHEGVPDRCREKCGDRQLISHRTTYKKFEAVVHFYGWLARTYQTGANPATGAHSFYYEDHGEAIKRRRKPHTPTVDEVRTLIDTTPHLNHAIMYAFAAKHGLRIHELFLLYIDDKHMDLEAGWMKLREFEDPRTGKPEGKRRGNRTLYLDWELRTLLKSYLRWRSRKMAPGQTFKDEHGRDIKHQLVLNNKGAPMSRKFLASHQQFLRKDLERAGLLHGGGGYGNAITWHAFRYFFSNHLDDRKCPSRDYRFLRGDVLRDTEGTYLIERGFDAAKAAYEEYGPIIQFKAHRN